MALQLLAPPLAGVAVLTATSCPAQEPPPAPAAQVAPASPTPAAPAAVFGYDLANDLAGRFDETRAFANLEAQVAMGPRVPGSGTAATFVAWLEEELAAAGIAPTRQGFRATNALTYESVEGTNVLATVNPGAARFVLLSCHWDCRARSDQERDPRAARLPVPGANDSASGVAVLLEVARVLRDRPLPADLGVLLAFFDMEDQGRTGDQETYSLGAKFFAENFDRSRHVVAALNVDMVGDRNLVFKIERHSLMGASELLDSVWNLGSDLFPAHFSRAQAGPIFDDHVRLQRIGLPSINLIDLEYPEWHTQRDLPAACSPQSLRVTGATLLSFLGHGATYPPR